MSGKVSEDMSGKVSEDMSGKISEDMSGKVSEDMSGKVSVHLREQAFRFEWLSVVLHVSCLFVGLQLFGFSEGPTSARSTRGTRMCEDIFQNSRRTPLIFLMCYLNIISVEVFSFLSDEVLLSVLVISQADFEVGLGGRKLAVRKQHHKSH
jgi:hypothetical protein